MNYRPVFIMGCPRSGTTLLASMLASSSEAFALPELHFLHEMLKYCLIFGNDSRAIKKLLKRSPYFLALGLPCSEVQLSDFVGSGDPLGVIERILAAYLKVHTNKDPSLWIEHSPQNSRDFHMLMHYFPGARFIHVIRDGRAVFNSVKKPRWGPADVVNGAEWWSRNIRECLVLEGLYPRDIRRIRYEQLATHPQNTLREVCAWLDHPYTEDMLMAQGIIKPSYSRHHPLVGKPVDASAVDKWKRELSRREIDYFTHKNRDLLGKLGYLEPGVTSNPFSRPVELFVKRLGKLTQRRDGKRFKKQLMEDVMQR